MLSALSLAHGLHLVLFLGKCHSKASLLAVQNAPNDTENSSSLELGSIGLDSSSIGIDKQEVDVDVSKPEDWDFYIKEGRRLFEQWATEAGEGVGSYPALDRFFELETPLPGRITAAQIMVLDHFNMSTKRNDQLAFDQWAGYLFRPPHYNRAMGGGCDLNDVWLRCQINAQPWTDKMLETLPSPDNPMPGALLIEAWHRDPYEGDSFDANADVLWAMWRAAVSRADGQLSSLRFVCYDPVTDDDTLKLIKYALARFAAETSKESVSFFIPPPRVLKGLEPENDANAGYWALLGSPAGANVMAMLTRYKGPVTRKWVNGIFIHSERKGLSKYGPGRGDYALTFLF